MWKHSLMNDIANSKSASKVFKAVMRKELEEAQTFYFGEAGTKILIESMRQRSGQFEGENAVSGNLPYKKCLFEFFIKEETTDIGRCAAYLSSNDDNITITPFVKPFNLEWRPSIYSGIVRKGEAGVMGLDTPYAYEPDDCIEYQKKLLPVIVWLTNMSLMLLECKNITVDSVIPSQKQNKRRAKDGKGPLFEYKVLNVRLPSSRTKAQRDKVEPDAHNRVHLCRGHFKDYTEENPLFGKIIGRFWWQPQARGRGVGMVKKSYRCNVAEECNG